MNWVSLSFLLGWPQDQAHAMSKGQSECGSNLPTVGVLCLSKYPVMNAQKKREKRHTIKKGETAKLKKETERKKERKHEPWNSFCYCLVAKSRPLYSDPMEPTGFSVHGILQARILKWAAISFSSGSSWIRKCNPYLLHCQADSLPLPYLKSLIHERKKRNRHRLFLNSHRNHT